MTRALLKVNDSLLASALCTKCGLCCNGSLFADVELSGPREALRMECAGLDIEDDDERQAVLLQPCAALQGARCSIYAHRPKCCRTFECFLLKRTLAGEISMEIATRKVKAALALLEKVDVLLKQRSPAEKTLSLRERCFEAIAAGEETADPARRARGAELRSAVASFERMVRRVFLGDDVCS